MRPFPLYSSVDVERTTLAPCFEDALEHHLAPTGTKETHERPLGDVGVVLLETDDNLLL